MRTILLYDNQVTMFRSATKELIAPEMTWKTKAHNLRARYNRDLQTLKTTSLGQDKKTYNRVTSIRLNYKEIHLVKC